MWSRLTFQPHGSKSSNEEQGFKQCIPLQWPRHFSTQVLQRLGSHGTRLIRSSVLFGTKSLTVWLSQDAKCQLHHAPHLLHPHQLLWHSRKTNICTRTVKDTDQLKAPVLFTTFDLFSYHNARILRHVVYYEMQFGLSSWFI